MAKGENQKLKLMYLAQLFREKTDEEHGVTLEDMRLWLENCGVSSERKSLYSDIEALRQYGYDIIKEQKERTCYYKLVNRDFELAELKLLVDSVQASKFITAKKSSELIKKIERLTSVYSAKALQRHVYVTDRVKTMNESIYYNVDSINDAINNNCRISFRYFQWNVKRQMEYKHGGSLYRISPWELVWHDENYYMVGYDAEADGIKYYRVDKMKDITLLEEKREGKEVYEESFDKSSFSRKLFSMFDGEKCRVKLEFDNSLAGVVIDRFGRETPLIPVDEGHFTISADIYVSQQFFGWLFAMGTKARIVEPQGVVDKWKAALKAAQDMFEQ
ncbi:MAG: helix-turn-helix transcriptional regulator [Lachnospiraceae bacterium]